jgi:E3 SUMO-protein ligase RanBP2
LSTNLQQGWAAESNAPDFAPILPLPAVLVAAKTGEEDEQVIFSHRAYLCLRSNTSTIWNAIGLGVVKILRINDSGDSRIVFIRYCILKFLLLISMQLTFFSLF